MASDAPRVPSPDYLAGWAACREAAAQLADQWSGPAAGLIADHYGMPVEQRETARLVAQGVAAAIRALPDPEPRGDDHAD